MIQATAQSFHLVRDVTPPEVWIEAPFRSDDGHIPVTWGADDGQSGVATYDLAVRVEDGDWQPVLTQTTATSHQFTSLPVNQSSNQPGEYFTFRVTATDHACDESQVGNAAQAEARTHLVRVSKYYKQFGAEHQIAPRRHAGRDARDSPRCWKRAAKCQATIRNGHR